MNRCRTRSHLARSAPHSSEAPPLRALLALMLLAPGCTCSKKLTDEERLRRRVDTTSVHLYVATKVAIARTGSDPVIKQARDRLMELVHAASPSSAPASQPAHGRKLGLRDAARLVRAVWKLKKTGERIVRQGREDELRPVLPGLLAGIKAPDALVEAMGDRNTEHAVFFLAATFLKAHPRSPVPLPPEIVLYEAWKSDADALKLPGLCAPVHALKAFTYGSNDLCDLARHEAEAVERVAFNRKLALELLELTGMGGGGLTDNVERVDAGLRILGHGGVVVCHLGRGDDREARPSLKRIVKTAEQIGADGDDLEHVRAFLDCGGDRQEVQRGLSRIEKLRSRGSGVELDALLAYCQASKQTSSDLARKVALTGKLLGVALHHARRAGGAEQVERSPLLSAAGGFARLSSLTARGTGRGTRIIRGLIEKIGKKK